MNNDNEKVTSENNTKDPVLNALLEIKYTIAEKELLEREVMIKRAFKTLTNFIDSLHFYFGADIIEIEKLKKSITDDIEIYIEIAEKYKMHDLISDSFYERCVSHKNIYMDRLVTLNLIVDHKRNKK